MKANCVSILFAAAALSLAGCAPQTVTREVDYSRGGVQTRNVRTENDKVISELHRVMDNKVVEGRGRFKHDNENMARTMATNIAVNDLAKRAGQVLSEEDSTLYNDQVRMVIRTRARNIVQGYQVVHDTYDASTHTAEVLVRQEGERIASELAREIRYP